MSSVQHIFSRKPSIPTRSLFTRSYRTWQEQEYTRVLTGSRMIDTAVGPVEYQSTGEGPVVLYSHGTPGGYDQGIAFARFMKECHCTLLSPSRPGYLRTPLSSGPSPAEQADLYAALLDALGIATASIIGFSGGGPSALQFAARHPARCRSLIMLGGLVQRHLKQQRQQALPVHKRLAARVGDRVLVSDPFIYMSIPITRLLPAGEAVAGMLCSGAQYHLRKIGYENDLVQFAAIDSYPFEQITAPTLVIHGTKDEDVPFADAELLARSIPGTRLLAIQGGDHAAFYTAARTVMPALREFLSTV